MNKCTTGGVLAATIAAAMLLTACGGSDSKDSGDIKGVERSTPSKSDEASPSASADPGAPKFDFPKGVTVTNEVEPTGDPVKDKILRDLGYANEAIKLAYAKQDPDIPVFKEYLIGDAARGWRGGVLKFKDQGKGIIGNVAFYKHDVRKVNGDLASVVYCEDQSHAYATRADTGKAIRTTPSADDFVEHGVTMQKGKDGTWRMLRTLDDRGAATCRR